MRTLEMGFWGGGGMGCGGDFWGREDGGVRGSFFLSWFSLLL